VSPPLPERPILIRVGEAVVLRDDIRLIDLTRLEELHVDVYTATEEEPFILDGADTVDLLMRLCPGVFEGKRFRFVRHSWAIHNLIAHPLMQVFTWLGKRRFGLWLHDATIPTPRGPRH
jgi:hypothetical protein